MCMFLKQENFNMENSFLKNQKMSLEIIHLQKKLKTEKDTF